MSQAKILKFGVIHSDGHGRLNFIDFQIDLNNQFEFPYGKEIGILKLIIERLQSELNTYIIKSTAASYREGYETQPLSIDQLQDSNVVPFQPKDKPNE